VDGKVRKYYTITEQGNAVLKEASGKIRELVDEVLEKHGETLLSGSVSLEGERKK
jgi:DNA-binding PadR family transcriptional regulator